MSSRVGQVWLNDRTLWCLVVSSSARSSGSIVHLCLVLDDELGEFTPGHLIRLFEGPGSSWDGLGYERIA